MNEPLHPHHFPHQPLSNPTHLFPNPNATPTLVSQHDDLSSLDFGPFADALDGQTDLTNPFDPVPQHYDPRNQPRFTEIRATGPLNGFQPQHNADATSFGIASRMPTRPQNGQNKNNGQFGVLTPHPQLPSQPQTHTEALGQLQNEIDLRSKPVAEGGTTDGHFSNLKMIPNPPDLDEWRQKLFNVEDTVTMTEEEYVRAMA